jgi:hypothetical protein
MEKVMVAKGIILQVLLHLPLQ